MGIQQHVTFAKFAFCDRCAVSVTLSLAWAIVPNPTSTEKLFLDSEKRLSEFLKANLF